MRLDQATGARVCTHCGSIDEDATLVKGLEIDEPTSTSCPVCRTALSQGRLDGSPLLVCERCEGMLIGMRHFVAIINAASARELQHGAVLPRRQNPGDHVLACPACEQPMISQFYGGPGNLVIDSCERCQLNWLDAGELRRIARAR